MNFGRSARLLMMILPSLLFASSGQAKAPPRDLPPPQGIVLTGGKILLDFGDGQTGFTTTNLNRLDQVVWSGGTGALAGQNFVDEVKENDGSTDAEDIFGQSQSVGVDSDGFVDVEFVGPGYAAVASNQTATTLTTTTTGTRDGQSDGEPIVTTNYTVYAAGDPNENEFRVSRTIDFSSATPLDLPAGVRPYTPDISNIYGIVFYPNKAGQIVSVDSSDCNADTGCQITDWNGTWFAEDNDGGTGMVVFRDAASTAPALLDVVFEEETEDNLTAIAVLQPDGFASPLTEVEWLCFYDPSTWPYADQQAGNLPKGCAQKNAAPVDASAVISGHIGGGGSLEAGSLVALMVLVLRRARRGILHPAATGAAGATCIALLIAAAPASAEDSSEAYQPYIGVRAGISDYQFSPTDLDRRLGSAAGDVDSATISKRQFGGTLYGGVPIYKSLMLELGYTQLGQFPLSIKATSADNAALAQRILGQLAPAGHGVSAGFALPLQFGSKFGIESRLSALYYQSKQVVAISIADYNNDLRGVGVDAGFSLTLRVAAPVYLGVGADCLHITQACNVLLYTAQVEYRFGQR